jgi:hypothetical protein
MQKYKQHRKLTKVICDYCNIEFEKPDSEFKRNVSLGRKNYCSRNCTGKNMVNIKRLKSYDRYDISQHKSNKIDEFTPFKKYIKMAKVKFKNFSLTLQDLKTQWELQNGICPYSGVELQYNTHSNKNNNPIFTASLDKIDSSKGYIVGNIQFVSMSINYMKNTMSHEKTLELCHIIAANYNS